MCMFFISCKNIPSWSCNKFEPTWTHQISFNWCFSLKTLKFIKTFRLQTSTLTPLKINSWNIIPWMFGSDHFPFFSWVMCRLQPFIFQGVHLPPHLCGSLLSRSATSLSRCAVFAKPRGGTVSERRWHGGETGVKHGELPSPQKKAKKTRGENWKWYKGSVFVCEFFLVEAVLDGWDGRIFFVWDKSLLCRILSTVWLMYKTKST